MNRVQARNPASAEIQLATRASTTAQGTASATPPTPRSPYTMSLYDNIQRLKLDVTRIVPVHYPADNRQITMEELARWSGRGSSSQ